MMTCSIFGGRAALRSCTGIVVQDSVFQNRRCASRESTLTSRHFVEDEPEGKQVGARVQLLAAHLFWRHVACCSHRDSRCA